MHKHVCDISLSWAIASFHKNKFGLELNDVQNLSTETNADHYILVGSLTGVTLFGVVFCFFIGIATCIIHHKKRGGRDQNEREMPIYDTISPDYECSNKPKNILNLTVNDAYM